MDCEVCELRFKCFTEKARPMRVMVNWKVPATCGRCNNADFTLKELKEKKITGIGYRKPTNIGYCSVTNTLIHIGSQACEHYKVTYVENVGEIYDEINAALTKRRANSLPLFCEAKEDKK
jgi:hypothetical protein